MYDAVKNGNPNNASPNHSLHDWYTLYAGELVGDSHPGTSGPREETMVPVNSALRLRRSKDDELLA